MIQPELIRLALWLAGIPECPRSTCSAPTYLDGRHWIRRSLDWTLGGYSACDMTPLFRITPVSNPSCSRSGGPLTQNTARMSTSGSLMSVRDDYLKLVSALRPYLQQITGVVWAVSWRRDVRKGIFHDFLSPCQAVGTENVSFQKPQALACGLWRATIAWAIRSSPFSHPLSSSVPSARIILI
jgi:hypothetical protein